MDSHEIKLLKVQARLDAIFYKENGIEPNLKDYDLFPKAVLLNDKESTEKVFLAIECLALLFIVANEDFQEKIFYFIDKQIKECARIFYCGIIRRKYWPKNENWKKIQIKVATRNNGKFDGDVEILLGDMTIFEEVLKVLLNSTNQKVVIEATERLKEDFGEA